MAPKGCPADRTLRHADPAQRPAGDRRHRLARACTRCWRAAEWVRIRAAHADADRVPPAEALGHRAVRRTVRAGGPRPARTGARSASSSRCCRPTPWRPGPTRCSSSPAGPARRRASSRRWPRASVKSAGPATSCSSTSAAPAARRRSSARRSSPTTTSKRRSISTRSPRPGDCLRELATTGVDLKQYTTEAWVADLDAVRAALGYPQVNLWGGSYGTRVALAYLRRHPDRVRSMVLDGVAPPEMAVPRDVWLSREKALDGVLAACAASEPCRRAHPDLAQKLDRLERDYAAPGRRVEFTDPRTGKRDGGHRQLRPRPREHSRDDLRAGARGLAARGHRPRRRRRLRPAVRDGAGVGRRTSTSRSTPALHYSVICSEDAPRVTPDGTARARPAAQPGAGGEHVRRLRDLAARERPRRTARRR